ncbi:amino acid adenylation domain-containing protein [Calothrix brevissima NIES-22]|nr:amino acid adenylation domain-containing protein [Calothrix brevissima NIES-22]
MSDLLKKLTELSPQKQQLLLKRLKQQKPETAHQQIIPRNQTLTSLPLSFAQQRLWFLDQLEPNGAAYNIPGAIRLQGDLKVAALEQSLSEIIRRHEALRANFINQDGQAVQIIRPIVAWKMTAIDLQQLSASQQEIEIQKLATAEAQYQFDLAQESLFRASLVVLSPTEYVLLFCMHHIISDGWSMGILIQEVAELYTAFAVGKPSPLPELPIQYTDFAVWQRQWLQGEVKESQINYWRQQLANAPALLELPTDRPRPAVQTLRGAHQFFSMALELTQALELLSRQEGVTLFMTLLAAFDILLYRYTGQIDILVGSPAANRNRAEIEPLIGFFVNTLILRTDLSGNPSFRELLRRVQKVTATAYTHQDLPFELLVETLQPVRDLSHTPLFQVMFVLNNAPMTAMELPGLSLSSFTAESSTSAFDLTLSIDNSGDGLVTAWEYNTDLFDATTIERMAGHFQTLLENIVMQPEMPISQLPILTTAEQQQLLWAWNDTAQYYPDNLCVHELFEQRVEETPDAIAVIFAEQKITYRELNNRANQLAHYLQSLGVGTEVLVGICVQRSLDMVIGLLGILKAGGAYVPLDPDYPPERLSFMLADSQVSVLITQQQLIEKLPPYQAQVVCLDGNWYEQWSNENCISKVTSTNLAYVIYTSGSTGQPKGVMIQHNSLVNFVQAAINEYGINSDTCGGQNQRILQFASMSFDVAAEEIYPCLSCGATLVLRTEEMLTSVSTFVQKCHDWQLTVLDLPTAYWHLLTSEIASSNLKLPNSLRLVIIGGEPALPAQLQIWQKYIGEYPQLINAYGPTETTVEATLYNLSNCQQKILIGRPLQNVQTYILDTYLQPVPIGVPGELHIGGVGLARGYLNQPQLTQEKFIANSFDNSKLYKTGDLARYLPDGNIEYLGRIDNQVKVRGFRIELAEIEAVLSQYSNVKETVVIAREDVLGDKRLVAYLVFNQEQIPTVSELRQFIKAKLPEYMLPSAFVFLEALPLTPNGKVDRRALPAPELRPELEANFVAPRTPTEKILVGIWAEVLGIQQIGIHDNFFELGGDSILSLQIIARANQAGLHLTPKQLFGYQTIAELAAVVGTTKNIHAEQGLVTGSVPLTPIQHWFFEQEQPEPHHFNQSVLLTVPSDLDPEILKRVLQQLLLHHDTLRLRYIQSESWEQIHAVPDETLPFSQIDLSTIPQPEQKNAIEAIASQLQASLNLSTGPIIHVALLSLGIDKPSRLLIIIHHLVVDGVSWRILLDDLQTAYQQLSHGEPIQLPAKTTSFQYWAQQLSEYAQSAALLKELAYWQQQSTTLVPRLPVDYEDGANTAASAATVSISLNATETQALLQEVSKPYNTQINDILLTALAQVANQWTGANSLLLELEGHGREDIFADVDLSRTVGWFTTLFPVLLELETTENPGDAIKSVKEQLRQIPHKGIGYGLLRYLRQEGTKLSTPDRQAEICFNYLGQFDQALSTSGDFQLASESTGPSQSLQSDRTHLLEINALIVGGQLQITWTYSKNVHQCNTIENLAQDFILALQTLIAHCLSPDAGGYTPADFPLAKLTQKQLDAELSKIKYQNIEDIYPLSPMQQGMLFHTVYEPDSGAYFEQLTCTLKGHLNIPAFEQAWEQVIARHSIFRTAFIWENYDQPLQIVYRQVKLPLEINDWRTLSPSEQQDQLETFLQSEQRQGFLLSQAPLMRLNLIQLDAEEYQFIWSHHHLLLDGWSLPVVFRELFEFYEVICQGRNLVHEPSPGYKNYIAWLQQQDLEIAKRYWKEKLKRVKASTELKVEIPITKRKKESKYNSQQIKIDHSEQIQKFAKQHKLTINSLIQGAWAILLSRYSGETDIIFGATVSGRPPELTAVETMVGLFINTLPIRVSIPADMETLAWLQQLQTQQIESQQYAYSPLVEIVASSEIPKGMALFESIVVFENYPIDNSLAPQNQQLEISQIRCIEQTNYPLTVLAVPGEQLYISISYDSNRFNSDTITRMLGHLETILQGIITQPQIHLGQLPLLTNSERQQLLTPSAHSLTHPDKCIHELFELQVNNTPDAVALVFEDQQLTYQQLNIQANQLAHYLRTQGVGADTLVGICVERSIDMLIGILGILKAGGAYVPLDPNYPPERISFTLSDSQIPILLTQQQILPKLPDNHTQIICIDRDWEIIATYHHHNPEIRTTPANLAYIIYTSGSTGKPKGVLINHANVVRLFSASQHWFNFNHQDVWTLFHSFAFDFSVWEIWGALINGGRLVIVPYWVSRSPTDFYQLLSQQKVTVLNQTPSAFQQLIQAQELIDIPENLALRWVIFGGEALELQSLKPWFERHGDKMPQLVNMYGITETTVHVTYRPITNADLSSNAGSVIGCPIPDLQVYVLDQNRQLLPIGVPGEMYVAGAGLARGYLHRPELTSQVFVADPFSPDPDARLYKTGDLARYLSNGELEYLGRIDNQVKVRGFRIELGEIEAAISQHPHIQANVVIARVENNGDKRLVAYLVLHPQQVLTVNQIRQFLDSKLPQYMMPAAFVFLDSLPLTSNGKIDRRALPAPELQRKTQNSYVAPRTANEQMLATIWAEVLRVEQVGIDDNFFELGGDSILSLQIIARANQAGLQLTPKQLFEHPAIAQLALVIGTTRKIEAQQSLVTGKVPLTPIQHWFLAQNQPEPHHYNQSVLLSVPADLKVELLQRVLQQLLLHHDALRLRLTIEDGNWQQVNADFAQTVPLNVVDLSTISPQQQLETLENAAGEIQASLNLSTGPIMSAALFELGNQSRRLLLVIHHLAVDGVSWRILLDDLYKTYQQLNLGETIQLPPKTTSFQYWAQRLIEYAQSNVLTDELAYWLNVSQKPVLPIPVDDPQSTNTVASAAMVSVSLNVAQTQALLQEVPKAYNTQINDVLLTALAQVLSKWTGAKFVLLNLEGHGREDIFADVDLSRTVGWFTTIFPVLLELNLTENPGDALKSVKEQLRQIPHKGIGYGVLRYLHQDAEIRQQLQTSPPAQISFNYLGQFDQALDPTADFQLTDEPMGASQSWQSWRVHLLDIGGFICDGQLQIDWTYSHNIHQKSTIEKLADEFIEELQALIGHCLSPDAGGYTPSDFPLAKLTQSQLDAQLNKIKYQNIEDIYPLSPMQQGMLFHSLYAPDSGVYFEQLSCKFQGELELSAFEQAWQQIIDRHSVLRTGFIWENDHPPLQVVYRQVRLPLEIKDWRELSEIEQQRQLDIFQESEQRRGFELSVAPLMRLNLIQLDTDVYEFVWSHHHLLLDGWSLPLVLKEVFDGYEAICEGRNLQPQPSPAYRNYIAWLQRQDLASAKVFWQQQLQGFSAPTPLMVDTPLANQIQESDYTEQEVHLSETVTSALQAFAKQHQLTLNNLVQGAWSILLSRYSGEIDVVFGVTVSGRPPELVGVESMVGLFINTLPVRVTVSPDIELIPWLKQLQANQVECEQYSYSPLVEIQAWSEVPRGMPLFESIVVFENYPVDAAVQQQQGSLQISDVQAGMEITDYPLTLTAVPGFQLFLSINYDTNRFDAGTITRMLGHLQTLLENIAKNQQQQLWQLPLLTSSEQQQLLFEWNDTQKDYPQDRCIHELFELQVELTPNAVAVVFETQQLTYRELNTQVNQLAHYLQSLGVKPDMLVGICVQRSLEMVVGILAILKAGGAYVPLDPNYPPERLGYMLSDSQVTVLLTQQQLIEKLPEHQAHLVCLDSDWRLITQSSDSNLVNSTTSKNLAYVIYTSGSTGQPKGVMVNHENLVNAYFAWEDAYQLRNLCNSHLQMASFSFDVFSGDVVRSLISGGKLVICPRELLLEPEQLYRLIQTQSINCAEFVPAVFRNLVQYLETTKQNLSFMKLLILGSDSWYIQEYQQFQRFLGDETRLINSYGVTEATIDSSYFETASVNLWSEGLVPIGRPFANTQFYILDQHLQPVPIGVSGELYIGGASICRGYLHRPELTQEKFIPNPFTQEEGARLYKTGDLARYLPDGNIEYLERSDRQVKIRGFRIELGEIEAILSQHPQVQTSVVIVREDTPGDKRLVAYLVPYPEQKPTITQMRNFLKESLPEYMIPSAFVFLDILPLTPNGKVDRRVLPAPDINSLVVNSNFVPPLDLVEQQLAEIWSEILNIYPLGIRDDFFDLGGHSLLAVQLMAKIEQQFGKVLPLATLFQNSTIEHLASLLRQPIDVFSWSSLVPIQPKGSQQPFFCIPGAGGNPLYLYNLAHHLGREQPFYALQALGLDGESTPHTSIEEMAAYYIQAIQSVQSEGPYFLGGHSLGGMVAFEMACQLQKLGHQVALLALIDCGAPEDTDNLKIAQQNKEIDDADWLYEIGFLFEQFYGSSLDISYEVLQSLTKNAQLQYFQERLQIANLLPADIGLKQLRGLMQVYKTNMQIVYATSEIYTNKITCFLSSELEDISADNSEELADTRLDWSKFSAQPLDIYFVPGNHATMLNEPNVQVLAEHLKNCIKNTGLAD